MSGLSKPLRGKRVLITRAQEQAGELVRRLERLGARPVVFPMIRIQDMPSWKPCDREIRRIHAYDVLLFSSINGVDRFFRRMVRLGMDRRVLNPIKVWAIGPATARRIREEGVPVNLVPREFSSEGLAHALKNRTLRGRRVLYPRASIGSDVAIREIRKRGGFVKVVPVYRIVPGRARSGISWETIDVITFASAQTVRNFAAIAGKLNLEKMLKRAKIACIGPVTAREVLQQGWRVDAVARKYTIPGLIKAVVNLCVDRAD